MLKTIKGAIFDMDGTLLDSLKGWEYLWEELGNRFLSGKKFLVTPEEDKAVRTMILTDAMEYLHNRYGIGKDVSELVDIVNKMNIGLYSDKYELKKGALEFLEYCYSKGIKMCLASATDMTFVNMAIERCGLRKYFVDVISCSEIGKGKDKPDVFLKALECLGTSAEETCVFEDSYVSIVTANSLGMKTVGIYDKYNYDHDEIKKIADKISSEVKR